MQQKELSTKMKQLLILGVIASFFIDLKLVKAEQDFEEIELEYKRYLRDIGEVLSNDPYFASQYKEEDFFDSTKDGETAKYLQFVSQEIRTKLNELKRTELGRLRMLTRRLERFDLKSLEANKADMREGFDPRNMVAHVDHFNPEIFGQNDIKNLLKQTRKDLALIEKQKNEEFKIYEMKKEFLRRQRFKGVSPAQREEMERKLRESQARHKDHPKVLDPGSNEQIEEVWKEEHEDQDFNIKTFFIEHDLNGDGLLDSLELEAIFIKEVEKMYQEGNPDDDMVEKYQERYRMVLHFIHTADVDNDGFLSLSEIEVHSNDKTQQEKYLTLEETQKFTEEEYLAFEKKYKEKHPE